MPQIREYNLQSQVQGPISPPGRRANSGGEAIGQGLEQLGAGIAQGGALVERKQISDNTEKANTQLSGLHSRYSTAWADTIAKADPNDSGLAKRFIDKFDEDAATIGQDISTPQAQNYYKQNLNSLRTNFVQTAVSGQAELKKVATQQNYQQSLNDSAGALMNDPTSFEAVKNLHNSALDTLVNSGSLPREAALKLQTSGNGSLAESAIRGWIKTSPDAAKAYLDAGTYDKYITEDQKKQLYGEAKIETDARQVKYKQYLSDQEKAKHEAQQQTYDQFVGQGVQGKLTVDQVMNSNLTGQQKEHFVSAINRSIAIPSSLKTDPEKFHSLFDRITNTPDGDPTKITDPAQLDREFSNGGLSYGDLGQLRKELAKGQTPEGKREHIQKNAAYGMMKETIYRSAGPKDPQAPEMYLRAQQAYDSAYEAGIKNGKSPAELTDPDFVKSIMKPFVRTPVQKLDAVTQIWQDYKNKTKGQTPVQKHKSIAEILKAKGLAP